MRRRNPMPWHRPHRSRVQDTGDPTTQTKRHALGARKAAAILNLRAWAQSERFDQTWALLAAISRWGRSLPTLFRSSPGAYEIQRDSRQTHTVNSFTPRESFACLRGLTSFLRRSRSEGALRQTGPSLRLEPGERTGSISPERRRGDTDCCQHRDKEVGYVCVLERNGASRVEHAATVPGEDDREIRMVV